MSCFWPGQKSSAFFDRQKHTPTEPSWVSENPSAFCLGGSGASRNWRKKPHVGGTWGLLRSPYFTLCCVRVATTHTHTHSKSGRAEKSGRSLLRHPHGRPPTVVEAAGEGCSWTLCAAPAAARGVQRALVRLRFSVWCIERHRHRRLVRKAAQTQVGPLSGTRAAKAGVVLAQAPLLARRANARARQLRHAECSARWCDCDSAYGA